MRSLRVAVVLALAFASAVVAPPAEAAPRFAPVGSVGYDISYPQCGKAVPTGGAFAVIGINGGRNFSANPCLASQYAWAKTLQYPAMAYVNSGNPGPVSTNWPAPMTAEGGALCVDGTVDDDGCAYIYGRRAAAAAVQFATAAGVERDTTWWLDVESANSWDGDGAANAADLQGMYDYLRSSGIAQVGIYSTGLQWGQITGGYTTATAAAYRERWAPHFAPKYPLTAGPNWVAGVTATAAARNCSQSFTGGPTMLAQYIANNLDHNIVCGAARPSPASWKACAAGAGIPLGYRPVYGTRGADKLQGTSANEIFYAGAGHDVVRAGRGNDIVCGGDGRDTVYGQQGADVLVGDDGNDELFGGPGRDKLYGNRGVDTLNGGTQGDSCSTGAGKDPRPRNC